MTLRSDVKKTGIFKNPCMQICKGVQLTTAHLRQDEAVVVEVSRVVRAVLHVVEEKDRHDLCHAAA